eukprot:4103564-Amphidinium_carterae.1
MLEGDIRFAWVDGHSCKPATFEQAYAKDPKQPLAISTRNWKRDSVSNDCKKGNTKATRLEPLTHTLDTTFFNCINLPAMSS